MAKPTDIKLHQQSRVLELHFDDGYTCNLNCEYLRINSPSAEVRGHGPGQEVLQVGKESVGITQIEPTGNYAVKLHFDDGHNSGIYRWDYLYELGKNFDEYWQTYLEQLAAAGQSRKDTN
ncbi:MAG: DUF971 domain-containing protein [Granulosicoccaceae bacterium]